jgi:hypothetical protein
MEGLCTYMIEYHRGGDDSQGFAATDFETDLVAELGKLGMSTSIVRETLPNGEIYRNTSLISPQDRR